MLKKIMKGAAALCFLISTFAAIPQAQVCQPAPVGLVSWWSGDGNALNSRSRNNGTLQGNVTFAGGHAGQTFRLGGTGDTSGNGDRVIIGNPTDLQLQNFTIETWIRRASSTLVTNSPGGGGAAGIFFGFGQDGYSFFIFGADNRLGLSKIGVSAVFAPTLPITDTNFHHIAITKSGNQVVFYVDGAASAPQTFNETFAFTTNASIGSRGDNNAQDAFFGDIDEISIYNGALSPSEIAAIHAAGTAGKCKPTATVSPGGLVGWWAGDGNANDISGNNRHGTLNDSAFAVTKVGQGFDPIDDGGIVQGIQVADDPAFDVQTLTIEAWVTAQQFTCPVSCAQFIVTKSGSNDTSGYELGTVRDPSGTIPGGAVRFTLNGATGGADLFTNVSIADGNFHHVAATYDGTTMKIFIDGALAAQKVDVETVTYQAGSKFIIGSREFEGSTFPYNGLIDEVSFYNRALNDAEIASIFNAGVAGKLKETTTVGTTATVGDVTVTYPNPATRRTQQIPIEQSDMPPLPMGMTATGLLYDIATDVMPSGTTDLCFNLPAFSSLSNSEFLERRILHLEGGSWTNRTTSRNFASKTICAQVESLSPFAIVDSNLAPTAANVSVGGRVLTADGRGITNARVSITDESGNVRTAVTSSFGYYRFDGIEIGRIYLVSVAAKRYQFENPTRTINVVDELTDVDFITLPGGARGPIALGPFHLFRARRFGEGRVGRPLIEFDGLKN